MAQFRSCSTSPPTLSQPPGRSRTRWPQGIDRLVLLGRRAASPGRSVLRTSPALRHMMGVWERTVVIVSKDENLTKSRVRCLESRLIKMAQDARRANLINDTAPEPASLPKPDVADMEFLRGRARALSRAPPRSRRSSTFLRFVDS